MLFDQCFLTLLIHLGRAASSEERLTELRAQWEHTREQHGEQLGELRARVLELELEATKALGVAQQASEAHSNIQASLADMQQQLSEAECKAVAADCQVQQLSQDAADAQAQLESARQSIEELQFQLASSQQSGQLQVSRQQCECILYCVVFILH